MNEIIDWREIIIKYPQYTVKFEAFLGPDEIEDVSKFTFDVMGGSIDHKNKVIYLSLYEINED